MPKSDRIGLSRQQYAFKSLYDFIGALVGLVLVWWIIAIAALLAWRDTGESGFFTQERVGRHRRKFHIIKIRTMRSSTGSTTTVTTSGDLRITRLGRFLRATKIDELPQLVNILLGQMSFVGPRPDVPGFADRLSGEDQCILSVRPGITGPATLHFRNEEELLAKQDDPETYNTEVIYPKKLELNKRYVQDYAFAKDVRYIFLTLFG